MFTLIPYSGKRYVETKNWMLGLLTAPGLSLLSPFSSHKARKYMYVCVHICTHTSIHMPAYLHMYTHHICVICMHIYNDIYMVFLYKGEFLLVIT